MSTRKIEITETELRLGTQTYHAGDTLSFPEAEATEYIRLGWAKCCETGEQGERKPGAQKIDVSAVRQTLT